ncbi:YybH family protein [Amycolatopsis sp. NPDC059027]|uniref:YybH family protein n=1 Tax=unclassified Amycolatopsis TaxID=2618356 RepID=UPI00366CB389
MASPDADPVRTVLPTEAEKLPAAFMDAFNSGDAERVASFYSASAVLVPSHDHPVAGNDLLAANQGFLDFRLPIDIRLRHAYVAGDIALLITNWSLRGTAPNGETVDLSGTATDVAQRGTDGYWRLVIDSPFGTQEELP